MSATDFQHAYPDLEVSFTQSMTTRDGTKLVADVYTPKADGSYPVLLMRQPYGRDIASTVVYAQPSWFARQGYIVVIQDVRGRGDSEGAFYTFREEAEDGYDTVEWAASLPKSNGKVGMYGFSYQGATQIAAARARPPALQAIAPHMTAFDLYSGWFYRDGLLCQAGTLGWGNQMLREDAVRAGRMETFEVLDKTWNIPGAFNHVKPLKSCHPLTTDPEIPSYVRDWLEHPTRDSFWETYDALPEAEAMDIPMFHLAGWHDYFLRGSMQGYRAMVQAHSDRQFLVAGPWSHIPWGDTLAGQQLGARSGLDTDHLLLRWFDRWLKDDATATAETSGVRYFVMGANEWRRAEAWPPPEVNEMTFHLSSGGRANSRFGDGIIDTLQPSSDNWDTFNYDPEVPVMAPAVSNGSPVYGPVDLSASQQGNNILVFSSPPFNETITFVGQALVTLYVASSAPDTAFVVRLSHLTSTGAASFLTLGAALLKDGQSQSDGSTCLTLLLDDTCVQIERGAALRLDVASSAFPLLVRHPNTETDPASVASTAEFRRARQIVYHGPSHPSTLRLPAYVA